MPEWRTSERAVEEQERRRRFQKEVPTRYCPRCSALTYSADQECFDCNALRPRDGWPDVSQSGDPWLGTLVEGRYLITKPIATGPGSRIYRADSRIIPRSFAIKFVDVVGGPDLDQEGLRRRLRREIEALSALRNPHIVSFYDVIELESDNIAFVMDLIEGLSLDQFVNSHGPLEIWRALALLRQLANGVFEAHESGLVHRDLKPSNVMVEKLAAGDDFVRILDFGVVWVRGTVAEAESSDAASGYASPEHVRSERTDRRTDLYSIGALAFLLLTGRAPFPDGEATDIADAVLHRAPPTLAEAAGTPFPDDVEAFVARLLAKDRADRPAGLSHVIDQLDELLDELMRRADQSEPDSADLNFYPGSTAMGLIPTLGDISSPVLKLDASELTELSEAVIDSTPRAVTCEGDHYAFLRENEVVWIDPAGESTVPWTPPAEVIAMAVAREFALFALGDGSIARVFRSGASEQMFQDPRRTAMTAIATDLDGQTMVAGSASGRLYACRRSGGWVRLGAGDRAVTALGLSARGDQFAVARGDYVQIFAASLTHTPTFPVPVDRPILAVAFSSDDYLIAILIEGGAVILSSVITGQEFMRLDSGDPQLRDITFSADNHIMGLFRDGARVVLRALT